MDSNAIMTLIQTVGFPIFACVMMGLYIWKKDGQHKEELNKFAEALNNNTLVIQKLVDKLDNLKGD